MEKLKIETGYFPMKELVNSNSPLGPMQYVTKFVDYNKNQISVLFTTTEPQIEAKSFTARHNYEYLEDVWLTSVAGEGRFPSCANHTRKENWEGIVTHTWSWWEVTL